MMRLPDPAAEAAALIRSRAERRAAEDRMTVDARARASHPPLHDSEQVVGRIPVYHYRDELPPPILRDTTPDPSALAEVLEIVFGVIVIGLCIAGLIMWAAIASVATP